MKIRAVVPVIILGHGRGRAGRVLKILPALAGWLGSRFNALWTARGTDSCAAL